MDTLKFSLYEDRLPDEKEEVPYKLEAKDGFTGFVEELLTPLIFWRLYMPVPGIPVLRYVPLGPIVTLAPFGPMEVLMPLLLRLIDIPGAIFILFLYDQATVNNWILSCYWLISDGTMSLNAESVSQLSLILPRWLWTAVCGNKGSLKAHTLL